MIKFKQVSKIYPPNCHALDDVNLIIRRREFISIVGRSGAGKSTFIKLLIREEVPTVGQVFWDKQNINQIPNKYLPHWRRQIGIIFQDFKLLPNKTAYENVAFAMEVGGWTNEDVRRDVPQLLKLVGLSDKGNNFPGQLSGGESQRVAIARALAHRPEILIADEPTGNLDIHHTWDIIRLLMKINELGTTVILSTHNVDVINGLERRVITMDGGKITKDEIKGKYVL
ncbi:cell division ATP-binding protein FtsE [Patescibacteria group bacterium]